MTVFHRKSQTALISMISVSQTRRGGEPRSICIWIDTHKHIFGSDAYTRTVLAVPSHFPANSEATTPSEPVNHFSSPRMLLFTFLISLFLSAHLFQALCGSVTLYLCLSLARRSSALLAQSNAAARPVAHAELRYEVSRAVIIWP